MRKNSHTDELSRQSPDAATDEASSCDVALGGVHQVEQDVQRELLAHPQLRFSSLVVRRVRDGVCLEGVLDADEDAPDVRVLVQAVAGVDKVLNHLLIRERPRPTKKG